MVASTTAYAFENGQFVGHPKSYLLSCAGIPQAHMASDGLEYFSYSQYRPGGSSVHIHPQHAFVFNNGSTGCQINFVIRNGVIISSTAQVRGFFSGPIACERIVMNCPRR